MLLLLSLMRSLAAPCSHRCSAFASELVCPGLLALATALLATPCSCPLHLVLALQSGALPPQASAGARAVHLGLQLLQGVFERHAEARGEVLKVCQVSNWQLVRLVGGCRRATGSWAVCAVCCKAARQHSTHSSACMPHAQVSNSSLLAACSGSEQSCRAC